jgi:micrococcal nuclease
MHDGVVTNVVDGDTMDVSLSLGFGVSLLVRVRLIGVDTCEIFRPVDAEQKRRGTEAKRFVAGAVLGKACRVDIPGERRCKFGRYLATVYPPGSAKSLNDELRERGFCKAAALPP